MEDRFVNGYMVDMPDPRDRVFESNMRLGGVAPPMRCSSLADKFDILIKQSAESCVGYSVAEALYASHRMEIEKPKLASPLFIWYNSRKMHSSEGSNSGTFLRTAIKALKQVGFCENTRWKGTDGVDKKSYSKRPSQIAYRAAYDQRLTDLDYQRITGQGASRKLAWQTSLMMNKPIVFGLPITSSVFDAKSGEVIASPLNPGDIVGGHAMCALGYDENGPYGPQTWGPDWGGAKVNGQVRPGWFHLSWRYVIDWALDQWSLVITPHYSTNAEETDEEDLEE